MSVLVRLKSWSAANNIFFADTWVGVKAMKWLDGRHVAWNEWGQGEPNGGPEDCACMVPSDTFLWDRRCNSLYRVLCMRG